MVIRESHSALDRDELSWLGLVADVCAIACGPCSHSGLSFWELPLSGVGVTARRITQFRLLLHAMKIVNTLLYC